MRYSLDNPRAYVDSNLVGFLNILEGCRRHPVEHLLYASSSSVYGSNQRTPYTVQDGVDHPLSLYAASKKANEAMAHSYAHLFGIPATGLRFFTVYGPWGRPDMALFKFVDLMLNDQPIEIYGEGQMSRDFTYIDDLVEAIVRISHVIPDESNRVADDKIETLSRQAPFRLVNIGGGQPENLMDFVELVEKALGQPAIRHMLPMQKGDVPRTYAAPDLLQALTGFTPTTKLEDGVKAFVEWYLEARRELQA